MAAKQIVKKGTYVSAVFPPFREDNMDYPVRIDGEVIDIYPFGFKIQNEDGDIVIVWAQAQYVEISEE